MQRALVLSSTKEPLMPCHPARAKELLRKGRAAIFRKFPFTIILKDRSAGETQPLELKADPGSKKTGIVLVADCKRGRRVVWAAEIAHRGQQIKSALDQRRAVRRSRRSRHTRHRPKRFDNRRRAVGTLPPSHMSRVHNVKTWAVRLRAFAPLTSAAVETVRFDTQLIERPGIRRAEYQQGTLLGFEVREYLLEKWGRTCAYCDKSDIPLEIDHIVPTSKGGTNRISNLTIACRSCNKDKGTTTLAQFLAKDPERLAKIRAQQRRPLKDAAAVNATRYAIGEIIKAVGLPTTFWSGGRTKKNRMAQDLSKEHWIDATCIGITGEKVFIPKNVVPLEIKAKGHGDRQLCLMDKHGFPRSKPACISSVHGFRTGDLVEATVPSGRKAGFYRGRVAVRANGSFNITGRHGVVQGISYRHCRVLMRRDGYAYGQDQGRAFPGREVFARSHQ